MGMPTDHFFHDVAYDIIYREKAFFLRNLGVHHDLQQQVAEFFFQVFRIAGLFQHVDAANHFRSFLNAGCLQCRMGLFSVPRASVFRSEPCDYFYKFVK